MININKSMDKLKLQKLQNNDNLDDVNYLENVIKGNVTIDELRDKEVNLLYLVIDKSYSMYENGLEKSVKEGLIAVKDFINSLDDKKSQQVQIAITLFGSTLDMRPFKYVEDLKTSYEADEVKSRLYDGVIESCKNMIYQYDILIRKSCHVHGRMIILTDGIDNGSLVTVEDFHKYLDELYKRDIVYFPVAFDDLDIEELSKLFKQEAIGFRDAFDFKRYMFYISEWIH